MKKYTEEEINYLKDNAENKQHRKALMSELKDLAECSSYEEFIIQLQISPEILKLEDTCPDLVRTISPQFKIFWKVLWQPFITFLKDEEFNALANKNFEEIEPNIFELEERRLKWSLETFKEATCVSSLLKLKTEVEEILQDIHSGFRVPGEYADALMCLFDSAGRQEKPISVVEIFEAFREKLTINENRVWIKNEDNTYSHI